MSDLPHPPKSILFIDGHDLDRHYYAQRLKAGCPDFCIYEAASGKGGLELFDAHQMDCVILELVLPDMSGFEVLATIVPVARAPELPVIVLTQLSSLSMWQVAERNGAQAVLQKGYVSGDDLEKAVPKALARIQRDPKKA
jgi:DNA-binding NarL/FixJ family response regulator